MSHSNLLAGKKGLIMGVANERSIAWGVAKKASEQGAEIAFSYQGEILYKRIKPLADSIGSDKLFECDVSDDASIEKLFTEVEKVFAGELDFVVHSVAFASKDSLRGEYAKTTRADFTKAMEISCYSMVAVSNYASKLMKKGGSIIAMTYLGSEKVIPNYNVMGVAKAALEASVRYLASDLGKNNIRVNSISPGPIKTLAASGIGGFGKVLGYQEENSPMRKNVTIEEVGDVATFYLSDLSKGITGSNLYVDAGYNIVGMPNSLAETEK